MGSRAEPSPAVDRPGGRTAGRNLPAAIGSGVALAVAFLATLAWHDYAFLALVAGLLVVALLELDVAFRSRGLRPAPAVAIGAGLVAYFGAYVAGPSAQSLGLVLLLFGAVVASLIDRRRRGVSAGIGATCLMGVWVPLCASFLGLLLVREDGTVLVVATVALAVANDIGAYAVGSRIGRHKLAPRVSPGKSWEGFAGGVVATLAVAAAGAAALDAFDLPAALSVAAVVAVAATIGDLAESLVKRDLGVKDLGRIIPGHGGIMDRVDGILFALPAAHLTLLAFGA